MSVKDNSIVKQQTNLSFRILTTYVVLFLSLVSIPASMVAQISEPTSLNSKSVKTIIDSLTAQIEKYYIDKPLAFKTSSFIKKRLKEGQYQKIADPNILAGVLTDDVISVCRDEHFHILYNPELAAEVLGDIDDVPKLVAKKLTLEKDKNFGFRKAEILNGNIGYLEITAFSRLNKYSKETVDAALKLISNSRALIIDLRYGVGGSPEMVNYIAGHFFKEKIHLADIFIRNENTNIAYWTSPDTNFTRLHTVPIYILTSYKTFSAAEGLAFHLQNLKRAIIVGESTRGGAHTVAYRPISNGFIADIPFGKVMDPITKKNWEGCGITPDIKVDAASATEAAAMDFFEKAFLKVRDTTELHYLEWQLQISKSVYHPYPSDTTLFEKNVGSFGYFTFILTKGKLFLQKPGFARIQLFPINERRFRAKDNDTFIIEFISDEKGNNNKVKCFYDNGKTEMFLKNKE